MDSKWCYRIKVTFDSIEEKEFNGNLNIVADNYDQAVNKVKTWATKHNYHIQRISLTDDFPCWE